MGEKVFRAQEATVEKVRASEKQRQGEPETEKERVSHRLKTPETDRGEMGTRLVKAPLVASGWSRRVRGKLWLVMR